MDDHNWAQIETIIDQALTLPQEKRIRFVDQECGENKLLKTEVTQLLESIAASEGWLENPKEYKEEILDEITEDVQELSLTHSLIGVKVGSYLIKEKMGEGGMGTVYLAERADGEFDHRVAVKIIRNEKATARNIRRFEQERTILAGLNHPGIAKLFDGGITEDGFPYFVMEYVDGLPIDQYCREHECSIPERIDLFKQILEAVRHAHENLVVHRDLKPGNILVNSSGKVKILDFGISKLLRDDQKDDRKITQTGARLLTPKYAAPEQILKKSITTATDIYSLGIIFYFLLSNSYPLDLDDLSQFEMEQKILESEPPRPSTKSPSSLKKQLKGDLDAIALKAIRKEANQRYRVANEFLDDLNRYEEGLPVLAHEGSGTYRMKKFLRRNKKSALIAAIFFLFVAGLTAFYTYQLNQQRQAAEREAQKAKEVKNLLVDLFEANDPILRDRKSVTLSQLLQKGTNQLLTKNLDPGAKSELLLTLSKIYGNITQYEEAMKLAEESLRLNTRHFGSQSVNVAQSYIQLGNIEHLLGNYEKGKELFLNAQKRLLNRYPDSDPLLSRLYQHLGYSNEQLSNYKTSADYFQKSLDILNAQSTIDSAEYIDRLRNVARSNYLSHYRIKNIEKADSLLLLALQISKDYHGDNDIVTSSVMNDLGLFYMTQARYEEARNYFNRSLEIKDAVYGEKGHPNFSATLNNLAVLEETLSNFNIAESLYVKTLNMDRNIFGKEHPNVAISKNHLASIYFKTGDYARSRKFREEALKMYLDIYGPEHSYLGSMYRSYGELLSVQEDFIKAETYFSKADEIYSEYLTPTHSNYAKLFRLRGENYFKMKKYKSAISQFKRAAESYDSIEPQYYHYVRMAAKSRIRLGQSYISLGIKEKAKAIFDNLEVQIDTTEALSSSSTIKELFSAAAKRLQPGF